MSEREYPDGVIKAQAALMHMISQGMTNSSSAGRPCFCVDPTMPQGQMMIVVNPQEWATISRLSELAKDVYAQHLASGAIAKAAAQG